MEKEELFAVLSEAFPFWNKLRDDQKNDLVRSCVRVRFKRGENIHSGNECTGVICVRSGILRLYMLSEEGKEITLFRLYPGEICMLSASCALSGLDFDVFVDAEEISDCVVVGGCAFAQLSEAEDKVKIFALESAIGRFSDIMWSMQQILFMSFDKRLAVFLLDEMSKTGSDTVMLTHEQIAKYMGSAREVVSRMMKRFSEEEIVELRRGGVRILDKNRLRAMTI